MEIFEAPSKAKGKIVILGAGFVGTELAIYLKQLGIQDVEIVEMRNSITDGGNDHHRQAIEDMIEQYAIPIHFNTKAKEITPSGVSCDGPEGDAFFSADMVFQAVGMMPLQDYALTFNKCAPVFYMVGECNMVGNILKANSTAYTTAKYLGRYEG